MERLVVLLAASSCHRCVKAAGVDADVTFSWTGLVHTVSH